MKKLLFILMLICAAVSSSYAQEVYNEIHRKAKSILDNPQTNDMVKQINQFKCDALEYMAIKMREQMPDSTVVFLDKQAFAMNNFVNFYIQQLLENRTQPQAQQIKITKLFMDASYSNPLFHDKDTELVLTYYADSKSLTRFSLDTDWRRAVAAIMTELKLSN